MQPTQEQTGFINLADNDILVAVAQGKMDLNLLAKQALANRGLDKDGKWIGFSEAAAQLKN